MAKLKDVARLAKVSVATASQALNGKSVNDMTRKRVLECAEILHYVPNRGGQSLITGKSNNIHLVIFNSQRLPDIVTGSTFFYHYIMAILVESQKRGYNFSMDIKIYEDPDLDDYFRVKCSDKSTDGIVLIPQYNHHYSYLSELITLPHVVLNPCVDDPGINSLTLDHYHGGRIVAEAFIERDYQNIGVINGPSDHTDAVARKTGFLDCLEENGVSIDDIVQYECDFSGDSGFNSAKEIYNANKNLDALFCCTDYVAAGAIRFFDKMNIRIPEDVAIVGFDNVDIARSISPRLSTVSIMLKEVGFGLADALFRQIIDGEKDIREVIRPELILRESMR